MKIAIVGSRDFPNLDKVISKVQYLKELYQDDLVIISGGARGVDLTAQKEAERLGIKTEIFPADWDKHGKAAGMIRNHDIVKACDKVYAFWDGSSRGTLNTMNIARRQNKEVTVIGPEDTRLCLY